MKTRKMLPFLLAFILAGCVPVMSLHPLYDDQHLVFEEKLLGTFTENTEDTNFTWEFTRAEEPNAYQLIYAGVSKKDPNVMKGFFEVHLVNLDNHFFLDVYPKEGPWGDSEGLNQTKWPWNSFFMLPVHTFIRVETFEPQLEILLTADDNLKKLLNADPNAVKHELLDSTPVLTASTQQLQSFVLKFADNNVLFSDKHTLTRKTSEPIQDVNQPKTVKPDANNVPSDANLIPL